MKLKSIGHFSTYKGLPREIYILFVARIVSCMGSFIVPLLTLILTQKLDMTTGEAGNFSALLIVTQVPCLSIGGKLVDSIGRKKVLMPCQILGSIFYVMCGITQNHFTMLLFVVIASNLYTAASPAYQAMVADLTTSENRKASFSLLYLGMNIGMAISPFLGGLLFKDHLQLLFILDGITTLASTALIGIFVKESRDMWQRTATESDGKPAGGNESVFRVLKNVPILSFFILFMFLYQFTYTQWGFLLPIQFGDLYKADGARNYSYLNALNSTIVVICTPLLTHLTVKFRPLVVIAGGGILYFFAFISFALVKGVPLFLLASAIFTFGEIVTTINLGTFIAGHSPNSHLGRINSIVMFSDGTARALAPLIMGHILAFTNYVVAWLFVAAIILVGAASILLLNKKEQKMALTPVME